MSNLDIRVRALLARHQRLLLSLGVLVLVMAVSGTAAALDGGAVDPSAVADVTLGDVTTNEAGDVDGGPTNP